VLRALAPYAPGDEVRQGWRLDGLAIEGRRALVRVARGDASASLLLRHPRRAPEAPWRSGELSISLPEGALPPGATTALGILADRLVRSDPRGLWVTPEGGR